MSSYGFGTGFAVSDAVKPVPIKRNYMLQKNEYIVYTEEQVSSTVENDQRLFTVLTCCAEVFYVLDVDLFVFWDVGVPV